MTVSERQAAAELVAQMKTLTEHNLHATEVAVQFTRANFVPDRFHVSCYIEGRHFEFHWESEHWKVMPSKLDWEALLLEARPIR